MSLQADTARVGEFVAAGGVAGAPAFRLSIDVPGGANRASRATRWRRSMSRTRAQSTRGGARRRRRRRRRRSSLARRHPRARRRSRRGPRPRRRTARAAGPERRRSNSPMSPSTSVPSRHSARNARSAGSMEGARCGATTARDMTRTTVFDGEAARGLFPVRRDDECDGRSEVVGVTFAQLRCLGQSKKGHLSPFFPSRG